MKEIKEWVISIVIVLSLWVGCVYLFCMDEKQKEHPVEVFMEVLFKIE